MRETFQKVMILLEKMENSPDRRQALLGAVFIGEDPSLIMTPSEKEVFQKIKLSRRPSIAVPEAICLLREIDEHSILLRRTDRDASLEDLIRLSGIAITASFVYKNPALSRDGRIYIIRKLTGLTREVRRRIESRTKTDLDQEELQAVSESLSKHICEMHLAVPLNPDEAVSDDYEAATNNVIYLHDYLKSRQ